jgi:hypothetical protein
MILGRDSVLGFPDPHDRRAAYALSFGRSAHCGTAGKNAANLGAPRLRQ